MESLSYHPGATEFPHDNPLLDAGSLWLESPLGSAPEPAAAGQDEPPVGLDEAPPVGGQDEPPVRLDEAPVGQDEAALAPNEEPHALQEAAPAGAPAGSAIVQEPIPTDEDPLANFLRAVTEVAVAHGGAENAAHVDALFNFGAHAPCDFTRGAKVALMEGDILEPTDEGFRPTEAFTQSSSAWKSLLRGESGDLSACGDQTLDAWTADLVARLVARPEMISSIRRDLRRRGIAAYGMV